MLRDGPQVNLIYHRHIHHAHRSGYDQIANHLGKSLQVPSLAKHLHLPKRLQWRLADGVIAYDSESFWEELTAASRILTTSNEIYHFIYGENSYHYLGYLNGFRGNKVICTFHLPREAFEKVVRTTTHLKRLAGVVVVASNQLEYFRSLVGTHRVFLVPHGVDTDFFKPGPRAFHNNGKCLFVGTHLRDFATMRSVIEILEKRKESTEFEIITFESNFNYFAGLRCVTLRSGVSDEELLEAYQRADILVLPLTDCTANNTLLEAMACGLPIVSTDVGAVRDYVDDDCAVLLPPGDATGMAESVLALIRGTTQLERMGQHSRERALEFAWPVIAQKMRMVYQQLA